MDFCKIEERLASLATGFMFLLPKRRVEDPPRAWMQRHLGQCHTETEGPPPPPALGYPCSWGCSIWNSQGWGLNAKLQSSGKSRAHPALKEAAFSTDPKSSGVGVGGLSQAAFGRKWLPVSKKERLMGAQERTPGASGLQRALAKQHLDDLRVNESETCGLNFLVNTDGFKN